MASFLLRKTWRIWHGCYSQCYDHYTPSLNTDLMLIYEFAKWSAWRVFWVPTCLECPSALCNYGPCVPKCLECLCTSRAYVTCVSACLPCPCAFHALGALRCNMIIKLGRMVDSDKVSPSWKSHNLLISFHKSYDH